jgi:hypothetical protein
LLVGSINTIFGYSIFALSTVAGANGLIAVSLAVSLGAAFNYRTSRLVFPSKSRGQAFRFLLAYAGLILANWGALVGLERLGASSFVGQAVLVLPLAAATFAIQKFLVFPAKRGEVTQPGVSQQVPIKNTRLTAASAAGGSGQAALFLFAVILGLSNVAFLIQMLASVWLALGASALVALTIWVFFARKLLPVPALNTDAAALWAVSLTVAVGLCLLGGEGRLFYANTDWQIRDAVLYDLSSKPWPVLYQSVGKQELVLRAPLGMFILPALLGHALGWTAANLALLAQNSVLLGGAFVVLLETTRRWSARLVFFVVFTAFSGWDIVGEILIGHFAPFPGQEHLFPHLENWAGGLQYSSLVTDLFWAPNHAIPAWILAACYLAWRRENASPLALAGLAGLSVLWSPLAVMGAVPFVGVATFTDWLKGRMSPIAPVTVAPLAIALSPVAVYLTAGSGAVDHGLNIGTRAFTAYIPFLILEVAPLLWLAGRHKLSGFEDATDFPLCVLLLVLIPCYRIGFANDFMMRASIFPLTLLCMATVKSFKFDPKSPVTSDFVAASLVLTVGAVTPAAEITRALVEPVNPPLARGLMATRRETQHAIYPISSYVTPVGTYNRQSVLLKRAE